MLVPTTSQHGKRRMGSRTITRGKWRRKLQLRIYEQKVEKIVQTMPMRNCISSQHLKFIAHTSRCPNTAITQKCCSQSQLVGRYYRDDWLKIGELSGVTPEQAKRTTQARGEFAELGLRDDIFNQDKITKPLCTIHKMPRL